MRILVVDDSAAMTEFMRFALRGLPDLELATASDGVGALQLAAQASYDVVLLDVNLPLMDGMKVLSALREPRGDAPVPAVIIVTSDARETTSEQALELGAARILHKPVQAHEVRDAVRDVLGLPSPVPLAIQERRKAPRLEIPVTVRVQGWPALDVVTQDISPYGAFLISDEVRPVGSVARATLEFAHLGKALEVDCEVMHVRRNATKDAPCGIGIRFKHASAQDFETLLAAFRSPDE